FSLNASDHLQPVPGGGHPVLVPAQNFCTSDGWISLFVGNDRMWTRAKLVLQVLDLGDPRFDTVAGRADHNQEILALVRRRLRQAPRAGWMARMEAADVPCAPVNDVPSALADPQARTRGMVLEERGPYGTYQRVCGPLPKMRVKDGPAPVMGADTEVVLREFGIDPRLLT